MVLHGESPLLRTMKQIIISIEDTVFLLPTTEKERSIVSSNSPKATNIDCMQKISMETKTMLNSMLGIAHPITITT